MAHHGGYHESLDGLFVEAGGQLPAHVEDVLELEDLGGETVVDPPQLLVDERILDGSGSARREAAEEVELGLAPLSF